MFFKSRYESSGLYNNRIQIKGDLTLGNRCNLLENSQVILLIGDEIWNLQKLNDRLSDWLTDWLILNNRDLSARDLKEFDTRSWWGNPSNETATYVYIVFETIIVNWVL